MTTNMIRRNGCGERATANGQRVNGNHDEIRQTLRAIHHGRKNLTCMLKLRNRIPQHHAICIELLEKSHMVVSVASDIFEQGNCGADFSLRCCELSSAIMWKRSQPQEFRWRPLDNFFQQLDGVAYERLEHGHIHNLQLLRVICTLKRLECGRGIPFIVDLLKIHSSRSEAGDSRSLISPSPILTRCDPQSTEQRSSGSDSGNPVCPYCDVHFAPRDAVVASNSYCCSDDHDRPLIVPSHSASNDSWRNRNTSSIGGGK